MIRALDPVLDLAKVVTFYAEAPDYWVMAEGDAPGAQKAATFFTDGPPGCDPDTSYRLGCFWRGGCLDWPNCPLGFRNRRMPIWDL